jgi:hypothetical protein
MTEKLLYQFYEGDIAPYENNPLCTPISFEEWLALKNITEMEYDDGFVGLKPEDNYKLNVVEVFRSMNDTTQVFINHQAVGKIEDDLGFLQRGGYDRFKLCRI